ncbi:MAG: septum formation initiator family protein [Actinomycetota bacterium]|nr:septum formation initiator family protein [Actinomycetota bacterium]
MKVFAAIPPLRVGARAVAAMLVIGLVGAMAIQPTRRLLEQRDRIAGMVSQLEDVRASNRALERQIARLHDPDYVEQKAREIGFVRPGEIAIVPLPPSKKAQEEKKLRKAVRPTVPDPPSFLEGLARFVGLVS